MGVRIDYAFNWIRDFEEIKETATDLSNEKKNALQSLITLLEVEEDPEKIQNGIFNAAKNSGLKPGDFFRTIYVILLGVQQGPRLGPYILAMGKQNVIAALKRAMGNN